MDVSELLLYIDYHDRCQEGIKDSTVRQYLCSDEEIIAAAFGGGYLQRNGRRWMITPAGYDLVVKSHPVMFDINEIRWHYLSMYNTLRHFIGVNQYGYTPYAVIRAWCAQTRTLTVGGFESCVCGALADESKVCPSCKLNQGCD